MSEGTPAAAPATEAGPAEQTATPAAGPLTPSAKPAAPKAPEKFKVGDLEFSSIEDAKAEIARGRQSNKLLTEADKRLKAAAEKERDDAKAQLEAVPPRPKKRTVKAPSGKTYTVEDQ